MESVAILGANTYGACSRRLSEAYKAFREVGGGPVDMLGVRSASYVVIVLRAAVRRTQRKRPSDGQPDPLEQDGELVDDEARSAVSAGQLAP